MAYATEQLNIPEVSSGHLRRPYSLFKQTIGGRTARRSEIAMLGAVFSYSVIRGKPDARCNLSYSQFEEKFNYSRRTVADAVKALRDGGLIEQDKTRRIGAAYRCVNPPTESAYTDTELFLYTTPFTMPGEEEPFYLTAATVDVLSLIQTHVSNPKGKGYFEGSVRSIARTLNLSPTTVQNALEMLRRLRLVFRTENGRGVNVHKRSRFVVNMRLLRVARKKYKKSTSAGNAPKDYRTEAEIAADERGERERFYARLRQHDEARIDQNKRALAKDPEYARIDGDLRRLQKPMGEADFRGAVAELAALQRRERELKVQRVKRMKLLGFDERDVQPMYNCPMCSDTGFHPDGRMCACYPPGRRQK